jgi:hypothetical protein
LNEWLEKHHLPACRTGKEEKLGGGGGEYLEMFASQMLNTLWEVKIWELETGRINCWGSWRHVKGWNKKGAKQQPVSKAKSAFALALLLDVWNFVMMSSRSGFVWHIKKRWGQGGQHSSLWSGRPEFRSPSGGRPSWQVFRGLPLSLRAISELNSWISLLIHSILPNSLVYNQPIIQRRMIWAVESIRHKPTNDSCRH